MHDLVSFGAWVRTLRRSLDLTQEELAAQTACATITIRKIERDERRPSRQLAELLADALDVPAPDRARFLRSARGRMSMTRLASPTLDGPDGRPRVPRPMTTTVGRERDLDALARLGAFSGGPARLLTITGPPGVGKTRMAQELALRARDRHGIAALFVDLSVVTDPDLVPATVAARLPGPTGPGIDRIAAMTARLARGPTILVLDNFEQVVDAAPFVVDLLQCCPDLTCVVTSRGPLAVYGEHEYPLHPLAVPPDDVAVSAAAIDEWSSLALLAHRVAAMDPRFDPSREAEPMARICRAVDGLPLAIELAAAQTRWRSLAEVAASLPTTVARWRIDDGTVPIDRSRSLPRCAGATISCRRMAAGPSGPPPRSTGRSTPRLSPPSQA
jgi:transcriptional regulator with XRE-family HTH domain